MRPGQPLLRLLSFGLAMAALAWAGPAAAIVGAATPASDASHVVMILNRDGNKAGFCTGIVVAQDVILTAAHCVTKASDLRVHYPSSDAKPVLIPITAVARHPDYHADAIKAREVSIDLAMIRLQQPLPESFHPATLARVSGAKVGARFTVSGYGIADEGEPASSGTLRSVTLTARAPLSTVLLWSEDPAHAGAGACTGDSGGPVTAEGQSEVSALTLWASGRKSHQCGDVTQSLWLAPQRPWIDRVMQAWGASASD